MLSDIDLFKALPQPENRGSICIEQFEVSKSHSMYTALRGEYIPSGVYTRLLINNRLIMSDTRLEYFMHCELFSRAEGAMLLNGLGLGCALNVLQHKHRVEHITVIEKNPDVIDAVAPYFMPPNNKVDIKIIQGDAFTYKPDRRYNVIWHDIWSNICVDNLEDMKRLHRRYGRFADVQFSWSRKCLEYAHKTSRRPYAYR